MTDYDGLCEPETECGCGVKDFAPCGQGPYHNCRPARARNDGSSVLFKRLPHNG